MYLLDSVLKPRAMESICHIFLIESIQIQILIFRGVLQIVGKAKKVTHFKISEDKNHNCTQWNANNATTAVWQQSLAFSPICN